MSLLLKAQLDTGVQPRAQRAQLHPAPAQGDPSQEDSVLLGGDKYGEGTPACRSAPLPPGFTQVLAVSS